MKQTAVEWFYEQIDNIIPFVSNEHADKFNSLFQQAKEMEKEQTMDFALKYMMQSKPIVDYYNETYGGNK